MPRFTVYPWHALRDAARAAYQAMDQIREELRERLLELYAASKLVEAQRLEQRTLFDLEMIKEVGYCSGIENYSRYLSGASAGEPPPCLFDYLPANALLVIDESHQTIPQLGAMYKGDRSRKETLVEYGFRLPSALDNRPLKFEEWEKPGAADDLRLGHAGPYTRSACPAQVVEQVVRPTGLVDPEVEVRPVRTQVDDVLSEIRLRAQNNERVLVTTLTKRMAEDLTEYLHEHGVRVRYLHADIETVERVEIIRDLRLGNFDVLVGINLLREGLDMPEVALVAILDADKEGFLRSEGSLIQTIGRAARNLTAGRSSMPTCAPVRCSARLPRPSGAAPGRSNTTWRTGSPRAASSSRWPISWRAPAKLHGALGRGRVPLRRPRSRRSGPSSASRKLEAEMMKLARNLEFEQAARLRDQIDK